MTVIGLFAAAKDGGWTGAIRTLPINAKVRLVPNDNRTGENTPAFYVVLGHARIGKAWEAKSAGDNPKDYLRIELDDPCLIAPMSAALFPSEAGQLAQLVWTRRRRTDNRSEPQSSQPNSAAGQRLFGGANE
jgi:uncharacterized protein (DUF736 family)